MWFVQRKRESEGGDGTRGPHKGQGDNEEETETLVMGGREGGEMVAVAGLGSKCSQAGRRGEAHWSQRREQSLRQTWGPRSWTPCRAEDRPSWGAVRSGQSLGKGWWRGTQSQ